MMTRPIHLFDSLTSESTPAGGNTLTKTSSFNERRLLEMRARYARAELVGNAISDAILWLGRRFKRLLTAVKDDFKLRQAEAQLYRMSDRELADLGLCRADIPFAVREVPVEGVMPQFDNHHGADVAAANRNSSPAIFWAGRA
jgi:uncharacterized protein YjiS (DUF1127 family)